MNLKLLYILALLLAFLPLDAKNKITYEYDANNRLSKVTYSNGTVVIYEYDELGNRTSKTTHGGIEKTIISFEDPEVKAICIAHWDTDDDEELSYEEAAAISDIGRVFYGVNITTFNEFKYFTGLTTLSEAAFYGCDYLESIEIPLGVTEIEYGVFRYCGNLKNVSLPQSLVFIGSDAFGMCGRLSSIIIPENVTDISSAFDRCSSLTKVTSLRKEPTDISEYAFKDCYQSATLFVPSGTKEKYQEATGWKNFYNIVEMESATLGDVNNDGSVSIADVMALTSIILSENEGTTNVADINGDGAINIADVTALVNIIIGKTGQ